MKSLDGEGKRSGMFWRVFKLSRAVLGSWSGLAGQHFGKDK